MLKLAFCTYVRPLLEFASLIWSPGYSYLIESIEKVQRRFTKQIPGLIISYQERLKRLNISSLELRRLHSGLIQCFKIVFGYVDIHCDDYFEFHCESATRGHSFKLRKRL